MPTLAAISVYPIKSLAPLDVDEARIVGAGALEHDREFAIFDADGKVVNAKRTPRISILESRFNPRTASVTMAVRGSTDCREFRLGDDLDPIESWLSAFFDMPVHLRRHSGGGFPDDPRSPGPTLIGEETIREVASWFEGLTVDETRTRFRANLLIGDAPAFWDDHLFGSEGDVVRFRIGDVLFEGTNPCQRCIVPTRDTRSGEQMPDFAGRFRERREATLPSWTHRERFNHYYRLAVNTRVPDSEIGKALRIGDEVRLV